MQSYGVTEVEKVLRLPRSTIRALVTRGFVSPARGPRREYQFSFQDMIVLRTARALTLANVPRQRINRSLSELRRSLPEVMPLSGLTICAVGEQVVVRDGGKRWNVDSRQYLLDLDVSVEGGTLHVVERKPAEPVNVDNLFDRALQLEEMDVVAARKAYEECVAQDPTHLSARINLGRLLHEAGDIAGAERLYRDGLLKDGDDPTLNFNLGVLLEDSGRRAEAVEAYLHAVKEDPEFADAHFNLARLFELAGQTQLAIRHLGCYRKLRSPSS